MAVAVLVPAACGCSIGVLLPALCGEHQPQMSLSCRLLCWHLFACLQVIDPLMAHTMELVAADSDRLSNHGSDRTYANFHALVCINLPRLIQYVIGDDEDLESEALSRYQQVRMCSGLCAIHVVWRKLRPRCPFAASGGWQQSRQTAPAVDLTAVGSDQLAPVSL